MSSYPPYIPPKDALFATWLANYSALLTADPGLYGLTAGDAVSVDGVNTTFQAAYTAAVDPATRTPVTVAAKDVARASAEAVARPYAVLVSRNAAVTDANKTALGVTVPSLVPSPVPPPVDAPALSLISAITGVQTLAYKVPGQTGKSKPFGAVAVQVFRSVGTVAATDPAQATFIGSYTKSPLRQTFVTEDSGKVVTYFARYVTRSGPDGQGQPGPWSDALTLIVM